MEASVQEEVSGGLPARARRKRDYDKVLLRPSNVLSFYVDSSVDVCIDHQGCTSNERAHTLE